MQFSLLPLCSSKNAQEHWSRTPGKHIFESVQKSIFQLYMISWYTYDLPCVGYLSNLHHKGQSEAVIFHKRSDWTFLYNPQGLFEEWYNVIFILPLQKWPLWWRGRSWLFSFVVQHMSSFVHIWILRIPRYTLCCDAAYISFLLWWLMNWKL